MKVKKIYIDSSIDEKIKGYGVYKIAAEIDVTPAYIYNCIKGQVMSEKVYYAILDILDNK